MTARELQRAIQTATEGLQALSTLVPLVEQRDAVTRDTLALQEQAATAVSTAETRVRELDEQAAAKSAPIRRDLEGLTRQKGLLEEQIADLSGQKGTLDARLREVRQMIERERATADTEGAAGRERAQQENAALAAERQRLDAELEAARERVRAYQRDAAGAVTV